MLVHDLRGPTTSIQCASTMALKNLQMIQTSVKKQILSYEKLPSQINESVLSKLPPFQKDNLIKINVNNKILNEN